MQTLTKEAIRKLQSQTSRAIQIEDFDLIEELDVLADEVAGVSKDERRILSQPYELCGIKFFPITVAKSLWYQEKAVEWEIEGIYQESLLFWLLSLPNTEAELDKYTTRKDADRAVKRLSRRLHCTNDELTEVYCKCLGISGNESEQKADTDYGGMIAVLLREYGGTPEKWLYETPVPMIGALFAAYAQKVDAENNSARRVSASKGKAVAPQPTQRMAALTKFREKVNAIRELWETE